MNLTAYENLTKDNSFYKEVDVSDLHIGEEYLSIKGQDNYGEIYITESMKDSLCKYVGLTSSINRSLYSTDKDLWYKVLTKLYKYYSKSTVMMLVSESDDGRCFVKGICNSDRELLINHEFINDVIRYYDQYDEISIVDIGYDKNSMLSHVVLVSDKSYTDPVRLIGFKFGVVFRNDELNSTYCRMVIYYDDGTMYYLPSKYYNITTSRYFKTTVNAKEALEMVMIRVLEDLTSNTFEDKLATILKLMVDSGNKYISRMEYERVKSLISNACSGSDISDEEYSDIIEELNKFDDFEDLYGEIGNDYLWKCTAIGGTTLLDIIKVVCSISKDHQFYPESENIIREFLGEYLTTPRVCQLLAKKL